MNKLDNSDINELYNFARLYKGLGYAKVQMDTEHAIEILERLIAHENQA